MEMDKKKSLSHKEWRKIAKRERRRKIRRKHARERTVDEDRLRETLERSADYLKWVEDQKELQGEKERADQVQHDKDERLWLEREVESQEAWKVLQERRAKARAEQFQQEELIRKEFEEKQRLLSAKQKEAQDLREAQVKQQEELQRQIDKYIDEGAKTPESLRATLDTRPGKDLCPFFGKTATCRYGDSCSRNHRRFALGKTLLIPGFYSHFSLESNSFEYDTDISLEYDNEETQKDFKEFYHDVLPELESFGRIKTLKFCSNSESHLRGNVYIEYWTEREAARAWRKLNGRFYAGKQLNCEFANIISWRAAICGLARCPKGKLCNFMHTFRNPGDEFDVQASPKWGKKVEADKSERRGQSTWEDSARSTRSDAKDWRWSESPEPEVKSQESRKASRSRSSSRSSRSSRSTGKVPKSSSRSDKHGTPDADYHRTSRKNRHESNKENGREKRSKHKSGERRSTKRRKTRWDTAEVPICSVDEGNSTGYQRDTTDSEAEIPECSKG